MIFDVFFAGRFICHFPMLALEAEGFLKEVRSAFAVNVTVDDYAKRIELL